ncbi:MAG: alpha/beta hydrolase [Eubacteriales bacterium]|nr:alpha/beta hydrolase [Eubacteriales bacterium]
MRKKTLQIDGIPAILWGEPSEKILLAVHGKLGCKEEASLLAELVHPHGWQVMSIDLPEHGERKDKKTPLVPGTVVPELNAVLTFLRGHWAQIGLYANSIGAYFSLLAFSEERLAQSLFVSPVLDMTKLIETMMGWAGVTSERLEAEGEIPTAFGETLSWEYFCYAKAHPVSRWDTPTEILYAGTDTLTARDTVDDFSRRFGCGLTVMEDGEHWFHTEEQVAFLRGWLRGKVR